MTQRRIQMSRQRPWRADNPDALIVARPGVWGNPDRVERAGKTTLHVTDESWLCATFHSRTGAVARADAVARLRRRIINNSHPWGIDRTRSELAGHDLACWCPLDQPCHADLLLEIANTEPCAQHPRSQKGS